nr:MAG TPA: hypothetical protein [Caudoviricetes sp.]
MAVSLSYPALPPSRNFLGRPSGLPERPFTNRFLTGGSTRGIIWIVRRTHTR